MPRLVRLTSDRPAFTIREYYEKREKILIIRHTGGLGDILMHRMMFEDFKLLMPKCKICFACPKKYHDAVYDHPYIDELLDSKDVDEKDYVISYDTTSACTRHETRVAPFSEKNRSDIWANHCGVELTRHNMHITIEPELIEDAKKRLSQFKKPTVSFSPISAMRVKNLLPWQMECIVNYLKPQYDVFGLHHQPIKELNDLGIPVFSNLSIRQWMATIRVADYVVSVDSAAAHLAGGLNKPLMSIFTFADGKVYQKYYENELVQLHRDDGNWPCGPCYHWGICPLSSTVPKPCLTQITKNMLITGLNNMIKRWPIQL